MQNLRGTARPAPRPLGGPLKYSGSAFTGYILFGTWIEVRTLITEHGERYPAYRRSVPALIPRPVKRR